MPERAREPGVKEVTRGREEVKTHAREIIVHLGKVVEIEADGVVQRIGPRVGVNLVCCRKNRGDAYAVIPGFYCLTVKADYDGDPKDISDTDVIASVKEQLLSGALDIARERGPQEDEVV